jgi:hypothetical protein
MHRFIRMKRCIPRRRTWWRQDDGASSAPAWAGYGRKRTKAGVRDIRSKGPLRIGLGFSDTASEPRRWSSMPAPATWMVQGASARPLRVCRQVDEVTAKAVRPRCWLVGLRMVCSIAADRVAHAGTQRQKEQGCNTRGSPGWLAHGQAKSSNTMPAQIARVRCPARPACGRRP